MTCKFDEILKCGLENSLAEKGIRSIGAATLPELGKALTHFYLDEIGQHLFHIYEDEIELGSCDGKGDLGVDFVYQKDKGWIIFQSKYKGQSKPLSSDEISGFFNTAARINNYEYVHKHGNLSLKNLLDDLKVDDAIHFIFLTNSKLSDRNKEEFELLKSENESRSENYIYELKSFSDMKTDYHCVNSESEAISEEVYIHLEDLTDSFSNKNRTAYFDLSSAIDKEQRYKSILCTIKGTTLRSLWQNHKSGLFNYNIRGFLGENGINKKMRNTLKNEPDKFYFYNNGISAICTDIVPAFDGEKLKGFNCKNFSIINGAQTTTTIGMYKNEKNLREVRVLLKITKAEDYKKERGLNKNIITFNNSQTIIKASDFRSNDDIQVFLENKLNDFSYKGSGYIKKVKYHRKRVKFAKKKEHLDITMEALARVLYVFDNDPVLIFKSPKVLFDTESDTTGKYWYVFGDEGEEVSEFTPKRIEKTIAVFFLWNKIEEKIKCLSTELKITDPDGVRNQALIAKWHFLWAYGYLLKTFYKDQIDTIFKRISNGKEFEKTTTFIDTWFEEIHDTISTCLAKKYQQNINEDGEDLQSFDFKNWLRKSSDFEELKLGFKFSRKAHYPLSN